MEMLDVGDSLKKMLTDTKKPFDHKTILNYSLQIALGLAQLQYGGINHRDVKPSNVIVVDGVMKIIDFDISRIVAADKTKTVTTTNQQFSKLYASPYRLIQAYQNEKQVDENTAFREDSYSLGLVILELICHCHS